MIYALFDNLPEIGELNRQLCRVVKFAEEGGSTTVHEGEEMTFMTAGDAAIKLSGLSVEDPQFVALSNALRLYERGVRWIAEVGAHIQFDRIGDVRVKLVAEVFQRGADGRKHVVSSFWARVNPADLPRESPTEPLRAQ